MLKGKLNKPIGMSDEDWEKLEQKAVDTIILSLSSNVLFNVSTWKATQGLWNHLSDMYEMPYASNIVFLLMKKLFNLKMQEVKNFEVPKVAQ
jgi:hypothetical protein